MLFLEVEVEMVYGYRERKNGEETEEEKLRKV